MTGGLCFMCDEYIRQVLPVRLKYSHELVEIHRHWYGINEEYHPLTLPLLIDRVPTVAKPDS